MAAAARYGAVKRRAGVAFMSDNGMFYARWAIPRPQCARGWARAEPLINIQPRHFFRMSAQESARFHDLDRLPAREKNAMGDAKERERAFGDVKENGRYPQRPPTMCEPCNLGQVESRPDLLPKFLDLLEFFDISNTLFERELMRNSV